MSKSSLLEDDRLSVIEVRSATANHMKEAIKAGTPLSKEQNGEFRFRSGEFKFMSEAESDFNLQHFNVENRQ